MTYQVVLQQTEDNGYRATPVLFPDCVVVGASREEALEKLREALIARTAGVEIVPLEVGEPEHPWAKWAGMFKDHPNYEEFLAEIEAYRREVDKAEQKRADLSP
jgi:hypothetical protein